LSAFPEMPAATETLVTLRDVARVLGSIRASMTPRRKHYWHACLFPDVSGFTTGPVHTEEGPFEARLDLVTGQALGRDGRGRFYETSLQETPPRRLLDELMAALGARGTSAPPAVDATLEAGGGYDQAAASAYLAVVDRVGRGLTAFQHQRREETGPVAVWPHHFDIAVLWFPGRLVGGADPANAEFADVQMNLGFQPALAEGEESYVYATAWPRPDTMDKVRLPAGAHWETGLFTGAMLPWRALTSTADGDALLAEFLDAVHAHTAPLLFPT
jgi:hypothetical protein